MRISLQRPLTLLRLLWNLLLLDYAPSGVIITKKLFWSTKRSIDQPHLYRRLSMVSLQGWMENFGWCFDLLDLIHTEDWETRTHTSLTTLFFWIAISQLSYANSLIPSCQNKCGLPAEWMKLTTSVASVVAGTPSRHVYSDVDNRNRLKRWQITWLSKSIKIQRNLFFFVSCINHIRICLNDIGTQACLSWMEHI